MHVLGRIVEDKVHGNIAGDNPMLSGGMEFSEVRKGKGKENVGNSTHTKINYPFNLVLCVLVCI